MFIFFKISKFLLTNEDVFILDYIYNTEYIINKYYKFKVAILRCSGYEPGSPHGRSGFDSRLHHLT